MGTDRRIRVLMLDSERTWRGGEAQVELLMRGLPREAFDVTLAAPEGAAVAERSRAAGIRHLPLALRGDLDLPSACRLRRYWREHDIDVVHCHSAHAHGVAFLARGLTPGRGRAPWLVVSRRVDFPVSARGLRALKYHRGADAFIAISRGVRDVLVSCGVEEERIDLVPSGIDLDKFARVGDHRHLLDEFGLTEENQVVGNVAALAPHKNQADFIRAAKLIAQVVPSARFLIVGEGELRGELEALSRDLGLERDVIFTGFRRDVLEILSIFHCFVLSSYLEGLCTSVMDAQAMGIPVVATAVGGVPDLVEDSVTGLLVAPRRPELLARAVVRMLSEPGLRGSCARAARERSRRYDYRRMVQGTEAVYRRLVERRQDALEHRRDRAF